MGTINLKHAVVCAVLILTMGCKKGNVLQLGAPIVIPHPTSGEFMFTISVTNFASEVSPEAYLRVIVEWNPHLICGNSNSAKSQKDYTIHPLQPNEPWSISSELITKIANDMADTMDNCHCLQGACAGTIYFTLLRTISIPNTTFSSDPNQSLKVQWSADGNVANQVITDLHGAIPQ